MSDDTDNTEGDLSPEEREELERELAKFASDEAKALGLDERAQHVDKVQGGFFADQVAHTTIFVSGLSLAHDHLVTAALAGIGYRLDRDEAGEIRSDTVQPRNELTLYRGQSIVNSFESTPAG